MTYKHLSEYLAEATEGKLTWSALVKKYGMTNGKKYYDSGKIPKEIKNKQGTVLAHIDHDSDHDMFYEIGGAAGIKRKSGRAKSLAELDAILSKVDFGATTARADDAKIIKWIGKEYQCSIKSLDDLKNNWSFIKWSKSIEMQDNEHRALYLTLVDGHDSGDDESGIGELGMTIKELEAWLKEKGVKQKQKPKRDFGGSIYD